MRAFPAPPSARCLFWGNFLTLELSIYSTLCTEKINYIWSSSSSTWTWKNTWIRKWLQWPFLTSNLLFGKCCKDCSTATRGGSCTETWSHQTYWSMKMKRESKLQTLGLPEALVYHLRPTLMKLSHFGTEPQKYFWDQKSIAQELISGASAAFSLSLLIESLSSTASLRSVKSSKYSSAWEPQVRNSGKVQLSSPRWKGLSQNGVWTGTKTWQSYAQILREIHRLLICWLRWCTWSHQKESQ